VEEKHICMLHYMHTYASEIKQMERWFGIITQWAIQRTGSPESRNSSQNLTVLGHLQQAQGTFKWTATADTSLE
jgi:hypothetical protein